MKIKVIIFIFFISLFSFGSEKIQSIRKELLKTSEVNKSVVLNKISELLKSEGKKKELLENAESTLIYAKKYSQFSQQVIALSNMSYAYIGLMEIEKALEAAKKAVNISKKTNDYNSEILALKSLFEVYYSKSNYQKAVKIAIKKREISKINKDIIEEANSSKLIANTYYRLGKIHLVKRNLERALNLYQKGNQKEDEARTLELLGGLSIKTGNTDFAIRYFFRGLKICEEENLPLLKGSIFHYLGIVFSKVEKYEKAEEYFRKALKIYQEHKTIAFVADIYIELGDLNFKKEDYIKSLKFYLNAEEIVEKFNPVDQRGLSSIFLKIGKTYLELNRKKDSLQYNKKALNNANKFKDLHLLCEIHYFQGVLSFKFRDYGECENFAFKSLKMSEELEYKEYIALNRKLLSDLFTVKGDFRNAFLNIDLFYKIKIKEFEKESLERITEIESKYQVEKKEKENALLKKNNEIQRLDIEKQKVVRNLVIVIFVLTLIIIGFLIRKYSFLLSFWKKKNFVGSYKLGEKIGSGGSGIVYMATDIHDKTKKVAIKILREESSTDNNYKKRFKSEGAIIDRFNHPNIVKVIERGEFGNTLFLAMEYLRGKSLDEIIKTESPLKITRIYKILSEITSAISAIHIKNIIHRDLKPENIIVCKNTEEFEQAKLLDFGIAKSKDLTSLTKTGSVLGTIHYLAPEQIQAGEITFKSDIYSLGIICYELVTGMKPFHAEEEEYILNKIINNDVQAPIELRSDIPQDMNELVLSMLMKDPKKRPTIKIILKYFQEKSTGEK